MVCYCCVLCGLRLCGLVFTWAGLFCRFGRLFWFYFGLDFGAGFDLRLAAGFALDCVPPMPCLTGLVMSLSNFLAFLILVGLYNMYSCVG